MTNRIQTLGGFQREILQSNPLRNETIFDTSQKLVLLEPPSTREGIN